MNFHEYCQNRDTGLFDMKLEPDDSIIKRHMVPLTLDRNICKLQ